MYWFNDEYVHALCHSWYRGCSPSVERYSFPTRYQTVREELAARFPVAASTGSRRKGIPYSVFMPVDNMARYWYGRFVATRDPRALGPVMLVDDEYHSKPATEEMERIFAACD